MTTMTTARFTAKNTPTVPAKFWEHFVDISHNKLRPAVIEKDILNEPLLTLDDVFQLARRVVESEDMTVNADGKMLDQPAVPAFPKTFDGFEQFVRDFAVLNDADGITFTRDYCLKHSTTVSTKLRAFTHGYIERYGMPFPGANAVFIGGRYRSTWIGLHNDSCDTFLFPLYGRKRMMIWPPDYFDTIALEKKPALNGICFGHIDISRYAADATIYEVAAGEIFFIPAGWWHYNKMEELETTLTLSVGMFSHGTAQGFCDNPIKAAMASPVAKTPIGALVQHPSTILESLSEVELPVQALRYLDTIRDNSKIQLLLKLSAGGVIRDRSFDRSETLSWEKRVIGERADSPLFLLALDNEAGLLFAGGAMLRVASFEVIRLLVERLQGEGIISMPQLLQGQDDSEEILRTVQWLYAQTAIDLI